MCFSNEMRDILSKQKEPIIAHDDTLEWYLEEMLLTYKYNYKDRFFIALNALKPYLSTQVYRMLMYIGEHRHHW